MCKLARLGVFKLSALEGGDKTFSHSFIQIQSIVKN
jgi:hypothetical protein